MLILSLFINGHFDSRVVLVDPESACPVIHFGPSIIREQTDLLQAILYDFDSKGGNIRFVPSLVTLIESVNDIDRCP
jgi:hypothetical protein